MRDPRPYRCCLRPGQGRARRGSVDQVLAQHLAAGAQRGSPRGTPRGSGPCSRPGARGSSGSARAPGSPRRDHDGLDRAPRRRRSLATPTTTTSPTFGCTASTSSTSIGSTLSPRTSIRRLRAAGEEQATLLVDAAAVAGAEPAVAEGVGVELVGVGVARRHRRAADQHSPIRPSLERARRPRRRCAARRPRAACRPSPIVPRGSASSVDGHAARLGAAVELAHRDAEAVEERLEGRARQRRGGREAEPQRRQVGVLGRLGEHAEGERHGREDRRPLALELLERPRALEHERVRVVEQDQRRAAAHRRQQAAAHAVGVEERRSCRRCCRRPSGRWPPT